MRILQARNVRTVKGWLYRAVEGPVFRKSDMFAIYLNARPGIVDTPALENGMSEIYRESFPRE